MINAPRGTFASTISTASVEAPAATQSCRMVARPICRSVATSSKWYPILGSERPFSHHTHDVSAIGAVRVALSNRSNSLKPGFLG